MRYLMPYPILLLASAVATAQDIPKDLDVYGEVYPAACKAKEREALKASLMALNEPDTQKLWQAIETVLCGPGTAANERLVKQMLASRVKATDEGTGSEPSVQRRPPTLELARDLMAKGQAWSASLVRQDEGLELQYWPNEACVYGVTFVYRSKRWWISQTGSACD